MSYSACSSSACTPHANAFTSERSHLRSSTASAVQFPLRKLPFFVPRGAPGLKPPCKRHRLRPRRAGRWHAVPARVSAPHRGARLRFSRRLSISWSMGLSTKIFMPLLPRRGDWLRLRHLAFDVIHDPPYWVRRRNAGMLRSSSCCGEQKGACGISLSLLKLGAGVSISALKVPSPPEGALSFVRASPAPDGILKT